MTSTSTATTTPEAPAPANGNGGGPSGLRAVASALFGRAGLRQLWISVVLAAVLALITGANGVGSAPGQAIKHDLFTGRVVTFVIIAIVLWLLLALWPLVTPWVSKTTEQLRGPATTVTSNRFTSLGVHGVLLVLAILAPFIFPSAQQWMVDNIAIYALLALGLNVVIGYAGMLDLGYIAFFAIGAYTTAYFASPDTPNVGLQIHFPNPINPFFVFPIAFVVAALAGIILGAPTLRLRGDYLAIVTLGFGEIIQLVANNSKWTNGPRGAFGVPHLSINLFGLHYKWGLDPKPYYYLLLAIIVIVMFAFGRLDNSRIGRAWAAIREDEVAAEATGVPALRMKLLAFAIGASVSGFAGVMYATKQFFNPQLFSLQASFLVVTVVIFGGMGSRLGVVLGTVILQGLAFYLRGKVPATDRFIYFGAVVMLMMIFRPQGVVPARRRQQEIRLAERGIGRADSLGAPPISEDLAK